MRCRAACVALSRVRAAPSKVARLATVVACLQDKNKFIKINKETPVKKEKAPSKPKKKTISQLLKRRVWAKHIGEEIGKTKCLCCNMSDITQLTFNCGHIISESSGGETNVENLLPICQSCNSSMGTQNLYEYKKINGL